MATKKKKRDLSQLKPNDAKNVLWRKGVLSWKLHDLQKKIYNQFYNSDDEITTMLISRQVGKTFLMALIATETCIRNPHGVVKFVTPKQKTGKNVLKKSMRKILEDCPPDIRPEWKEADKIYLFPNGAEIQIAGTDNQNYDNIRGGTCLLWMVDEAGFCSDLLEVVYSVLIPTTTVTRGRGFLSSTPPPDDPEHPFITHFVEKAQKEERIFKYTLHDNPQLTAEDIQRIINKYIGGEKNPYFRAEYLCEIVRSDEAMVVPEFSEENRKEIVKGDYKRPPYYDYYVGMDIGGKDFTVALFGYYDFMQDIVVIEDEYVLEAKQNSGTIAQGIINKKQTLYGEKPAYLMFADNNNVILLNDLRKYHSLNFIPTKKDNKEASINTLRLLVQQHKVVIHPRCKTLISHLSNVRWVKTRVNNYKKFAKSADGGHYDAVDACLYLIRNIKKSKNPYPSNFNQVSSSDHFINVPTVSKSAQTFANIFKKKKN